MTNDQIIQAIEANGFRRWLISTLCDAFVEARKHKIKTFNEHQYEVNWQENIILLADVVSKRHYTPSGSVSFIIYDPMVREIFAAPFVDRVVHHLLHEISGKWWDKHLIYDSYSCRVAKGTLFGILRIQKMMRQASQNGHRAAFIVKNDIKGYFMSLPRQKVYKQMQRGLKMQFESHFDNSDIRKVYRLCDYLWHQVLLDDPVSKSYRRGPLSNWDDLPPEKSLYNRDPGEGIVIGNQTSQLASNAYLDQLDRFIKYDLSYHWYGRYVDDFIRIVTADDYNQALKDTKKIRDFLYYELGLTLHPKKYYVQSVDKGVSFLGARIYPNCLIPSNRLQGKFIRAVKTFVDSKGRDENINASLASYLGLFRHLDARPFVHQVFDRFGLDFNLYLESLAIDRRSFSEIIQALASDLDDDEQTPSGILLP